MALALGGIACGSDDESVQNENNWKFGDDVAGEDPSSDAAGEDAGREDSGGEDAGREDAGGADAIGEDTAGQDATAHTDTDSETPLTAAGLSSKPWYAISVLSAEPATTGSTFVVEFHDDMTVSIGFHEEVTGSWALFGEGRVRLFDLMKGNEPNQPQQLLLDVDLEADQVKGLEIAIPDADGGLPRIMRFEQLATADISVEDIAGNWQSEETFTGENGGTFRLAVRFLGGTFGYGVYNGAYVEFIPGQAQVITYDTGETFWFGVPPDTTPPKPSLAGEVRSDGDGGYTIWAPREVTPQSGDFESVELNHVAAFTNP
jgi:hypothetical protein